MQCSSGAHHPPLDPPPHAPRRLGVPPAGPSAHDTQRGHTGARGRTGHTDLVRKAVRQTDGAQGIARKGLREGRPQNVRAVQVQDVGVRRADVRRLRGSGGPWVWGTALDEGNGRRCGHGATAGLRPQTVQRGPGAPKLFLVRRGGSVHRRQEAYNGGWGGGLGQAIA